MTIAFAVRVGLFSIALTIAPISTKAITVQDVPGPRPNGWVTDTIDILSPQTESKINRLIDELEAKNRCELMVITVPETQGYSAPRSFALAWFNHWTIGKKDLNNGVLLMYSRGDDRQGQTPRDRIEIVTGWGVTKLLPDKEVVNLIGKEIRPHVNRRDYNGAMLTGTQEIVQVLQKYQPQSKPSSSQPVGFTEWIGQVVGTLFLFFVFVLLPCVIFPYIVLSALYGLYHHSITGQANRNGSSGYQGGATTGTGSTGGSTGGGGGSTGGGGGGTGGGGGGG